MQKFIDLTIKPVLIIGGVGTSLAGLNAFFPRFAVEKICAASPKHLEEQKACHP